MSKLALMYVESVAEGRIPGPESPEAKAYHSERCRERMIEEEVKASALRVYGHQYYLLGSMI